MVCSRLTPRVMPLMSSVMLSRFLATVSSVSRWPTVPSPSAMRPVILSTLRNDLSRLSMLLCSFCKRAAQILAGARDLTLGGTHQPLDALRDLARIVQGDATSSASDG